MAADRLIARLMSGLRRLRRNRRGVAAVEFAMIAPIFLVVLCGIIENGLILCTQFLLDNATRDAARMIMLGSTSESAFSNQIKTEVSSLINGSDIRYNVVSGTSFASLPTTLTTDASGNIINTYSPGGSAQQAVLVRVGYNRPFLFPGYGTFVGMKSELLVSTVVMKSEPY